MRKLWNRKNGNRSVTFKRKKRVKLHFWAKSTNFEVIFIRFDWIFCTSSFHFPLTIEIQINMDRTVSKRIAVINLQQHFSDSTFMLAFYCQGVFKAAVLHALIYCTIKLAEFTNSRKPQSQQRCRSADRSLHRKKTNLLELTKHIIWPFSKWVISFCCTTTWRLLVPPPTKSHFNPWLEKLKNSFWQRGKVQVTRKTDSHTKYPGMQAGERGALSRPCGFLFWLI